jgi:hypothetical protein
MQKKGRTWQETEGADRWIGLVDRQLKFKWKRRRRKRGENNNNNI